MSEEPRVETPKVEEPKVERSIADELGKLGQQVASAAKAAWESDERRKLQAELTRGVEKFSEELSVTVDKAADSPQAKDLRVKAEKVAEEVRATDVIEEIRKGILTGLDTLNRELSKLLEKLETEQQPVSTEPVVGETAVPVTPVGESPVVDTPVEPKSEA